MGVFKMPKITNFAVCEKADIEEGQLRAINVLQLIESSSGNFSFSIIFSITGFSAGEEHNGFVVISDPKGEKLIETERFVLEKEEHSEIEDSRLITGVSMSVEFKDILFEGQGLYKLELFFDDDNLGEFYIPVLARRGSDE